MLNLKPLYRLGRVITTPNARARVSRKDIAEALQSHVRSVEGRPDENHGARRKATSFAGCRMLTAHRSGNGTRFWIISESDQALTQVMLPEDYGYR